jgi:hypothetical protein
MLLLHGVLSYLACVCRPGRKPMSRLSSGDDPAKPNFREKFDELQRLIEADHIPI